MSAYAVSSRGLAAHKVPQGVLATIMEMLYSNSEKGIAKLDFSDFTGMYQDRARTVPYTAVEQPLGSFTGLNGTTATAPADVNRGVVSARVNLLTKTEQFDDAAWLTPPGTLTTSNSGIAPDGTLTAGNVECTQATAIYIANAVAPVLITGATYRATVHVRNGGGIPSIIFYNGQFGAYKSATINLITGAVTGSNYTTPPVVSVSGDGWVSISVDIVAPGTSGNYCYVQSSVNAAVGDHFFIWHPSLTLTTDSHLPYQRVNTSTDYDTVGFPRYLAFNGTNTTYTTPSIDFTGTDKMTVWAGFLNTGTTGYHMFSEFGLPASGDQGTFSHFAALDAVGRAVIASKAGVTGGNMRFPPVTPSILDITTYALDASKSIPAEAVPIFRKNSQETLKDPSGTFSTALGWGNHPLYIGARAGTSLFFNGRLYNLIVRGAQSSLSQIEATENLIRQKMRLP